MNEKEYNALLRRKNFLAACFAVNSSVELATELAELEAQIAQHYLDNNDPSNAAINLISQASYLILAGKKSEAIPILEKAGEYVKTNPMQALINSNERIKQEEQS